MGKTARQIGWSEEEILLWKISKKLSRIVQSIRTTEPITTTTTTTVAIPAFRTVWSDTSYGGGDAAIRRVKLPLISTGVYDFYVNWGDGITDHITSWNQAETLHIYDISVPTPYNVSITGQCEGISFEGTTYARKLLEVLEWGPVIFGSGAFSGCRNVRMDNISDTPVSFLNNDLSKAFELCENLTSISNINSWDTSSVTNMSKMFSRCSNFNQPLEFNTSSVDDMSNMFEQCTIFNSSLNFNTSNVTNMGAMFTGCQFFNQNINFWDVSKVEIFSAMFQSCIRYNFPLNGWNTLNATKMVAMFEGAVLFNQDLDNFNLSNVDDIQRMFTGCTNFNGNIVTWDTSLVTNFDQLFASAIAFNQPIGNWDTSSVTIMSQVFTGATAFNQSLANWNVSEVSDFTGFMFAKTNLDYSAANLDAIYNSWSQLIFTNTDLIIDFNTIKYTAAGSAGRAILTNAPNNWMITDGGI